MRHRNELLLPSKSFLFSENRLAWRCLTLTHCHCPLAAGAHVHVLILRVREEPIRCHTKSSSHARYSPRILVIASHRVASRRVASHRTDSRRVALHRVAMRRARTKPACELLLPAGPRVRSGRRRGRSPSARAFGYAFKIAGVGDLRAVQMGVPSECFSRMQRSCWRRSHRGHCRADGPSRCEPTGVLGPASFWRVRLFFFRRELRAHTVELTLRGTLQVR